MARHIRNAGLESRTARLKLKPDKIHRMSLGGKLSLGYQRGRGPGRWIARRYLGGEAYTTQKLAEADDLADANGDSVLSFEQAQKMAREWSISRDEEERIAALGPVVTVRDAVKEYLNERATALDARGKLKHVLADTTLAETPLAALTVGDLKRWRAGLLAKMSETGARRTVNDVRACLNSAAKRHRDKLPPTIRDTIRDGFAVARGTQVDNTREMQLLTDADIRRLVSAAKELDIEHGWGGGLYLMIVVLATTGGRFSQAQRLRVADLDVGRGRLMMPTSRKGGGEKQASHIAIPLLPEVVDALKLATVGRVGSDFLLLRPFWRREPGPGLGVLRVYQRGPWHEAGSLTRPWHEIVRRAGLRDDLVAYSLRHSSITRGLRAGLPTQLVAQIHNTSSTMIERYYGRFVSDALHDLARAALVPLMPTVVTPFPPLRAVAEG